MAAELARPDTGRTLYLLDEPTTGLHHEDVHNLLVSLDRFVERGWQGDASANAAAGTKGKNATDSAMIIDAMDILHSRTVDGFCVVSSDSDFTRLASRLRESGLVVYGFGEKKTPKPFVAACDKFIYTEVLRAKEGEAEPSRVRPSDDLKKDKGHLANLFRNAIDAYSDDDGWAQLGVVGSNIAKQAPEFDPRNYGYRKLKDLVKAMGLYELREESEAQGHGKMVYIRKKRRK